MLQTFLLFIFLIFLNAAFASAEIAVISISDTRLKSMADGGNKKAARLAALTSQPARFLATIQVAITMAGFLPRCNGGGSIFGNISKVLT